MKKLLVVGLFFLGLALGYGAVAVAYPPFPPGVYNRQERYGFFLNRHDPGGDRVWKGVAAWGDEAMPPTMDTADEFIGYVKAKLTGQFQSNQDRVGAAFIIQTMIGNEGNVSNQTPSAAEIAEWEARVRYAESRGLVRWRVDYTYVLNSYYQGCCAGSNWNDDGFYDGPGTAPAIVFGDGTGGGFGNVIYAIKWKCANPVGTLQALPDDLNFNMSATAAVNIASPTPGQDIRFDYAITNNGPTATNPIPIYWAAVNTLTGVQTIPGHSSGTYPVGRTDNQSETYRVPNTAVPGDRICRQVDVHPGNAANAHVYSNIACATVRFDFALTPTVRVEVNDGATPNEFAEPGDKVEFIYNVANSGITPTSSISCTIYGLSRNGFYTIPSPADSVSDPGFVQPAHGCPRTFPAGPSGTDLVTETINSVSAADLNKSLCRSLYITPVTQTGGSQGFEACARIVAKPYLRVYGGDVSAGGGQPLAAGGCSGANFNASIIGWNRGNAAGEGYAGAAVQHAALALGRIYDVTTSQGNGAGSAAKPSGLAFANTAPSGSIFGGTFGSLPCIVDHYKPTGATPISGPTINLSTLNGVNRYSTNGPVAISGNINPNQRTILYVNGNVLITGNIQYPGSWNTSTLPLFELVASGNVYISQSVTRIDGIYIAQGTTASTGKLFTCANPALPPLEVSTSAGAVYTNCRNGLEINGALMAKQVQFLRTRGTQRSATAGESNTSTNIAEVINFSPSLWLAQPPSISGSASDYDAITSLPPIL